MNKQESGNQAAAPSEVGHEGNPGKKGGFNPGDGYKDTEIAENYDNERFSDLPGRVFDKAEKATLKSILRDLSPDTLILNVPTGTGRLAETILMPGHRVVGVDISEAMLRIASRKLQRFGERYIAVAGDAPDLAYVDNHFDAVVWRES